MTSADENSLPELSKVGFTAGRAATETDVKTGNAVFVLKDGEVPIGSPMDIEIPQYAYFLNDGVKVPVVVVQAEEARGQRIMGGVDSAGIPVAGIFSDFELLGTTQP